MRRTASQSVSLLLCLVAMTLGGCGGVVTSETADRPPATGAPVSDAPKAAACPRASSWKNAASLQGEATELVGPVVSASYHSEVSGEPTFLNIGAEYPDSDRLTIVIWGENRALFTLEPELAFQGQTICVNGRVFNYEGASEIEVSDPAQIKIGP